MRPQLTPIEAVAPSAYNPRHTDPERLALIELSLRKLGFVLPLYATPEGELLSGHQRHLAATNLGFSEVPVVTCPPMDLQRRKAVNLVFNRATNDLTAAETSDRITEELERFDPVARAKKLPDAATPFPCLNVREVPVADVVAANADASYDPYGSTITRTLDKAGGVRMPVVVGPGLRVVNGLGRLRRAGENGERTVEVVELGAKAAEYARPMLNKLSMDFTIHERYEDLLRHSSFRRAQHQRSTLGRGFVFAMVGHGSAKEFDVSKPANAAKWKRAYGTSVVDFGAGHLTETDLLRAAGVHVAAFEPFRCKRPGNEIDREWSVETNREFLSDVARGTHYTSVFISSVLNSVPFRADREHIAAILHALCGPRSRLHATARSVLQTGWRHTQGAKFSNKLDAGRTAFALDYEPGVIISDLGEAPKVQKHHTPEEFYGLWKPHFESVQVKLDSTNVVAVAQGPKPVDAKRLGEALDFEFDLPYPDGKRMGLAGEARAAFAQRLGIKL